MVLNGHLEFLRYLYNRIWDAPRAPSSKGWPSESQIESSRMEHFSLNWYLLKNLLTGLISSFVPNALILYPLQNSENHKVFLCLQKLEKGCIGNKWVKWPKIGIL